MQVVFDIAWLIILFPVLGLSVNALLGRYLKAETVSGLAVLASAASFGLSVVTFVALLGLPAGAHGGVERIWYTWAAIGSFKVELGAWLDPLSVTMLLVVTGVGTLIHIYSIGYMHGDSRYRRFFVYLNLFLVFMLTLVMGNSYLMLFVGWEGVGLCSYLLIGFWFEKKKNSDAANKAFIVNRIGDFGFLLGVFSLFAAFGSVQFHDVLPAAAGLPAATATAITLLLFVGAAGKSAQIPLYVWLPDAMAGPTPVSALIHAATMVTAGVYMIARSQPLYALAPISQAVVALVGALTALLAATIALAQFDIKKILAYSTISQLGFMISVVGMGEVSTAATGVFHLATHAFFKALLFLGAGSVIHAMEHAHHAAAPTPGHNEDFDPNDIRLMGGLKDRLPRTFWTYLIGALALAGTPPLSGFWSKDEIILEAFLKGFASEAQAGLTWPFQVACVCLLAAAFFTAFYMARQVGMVFFGAPRHTAAGQVHESPAIMTHVLVALAVCAAGVGFANAPLFGLHWFHDFYTGHPAGQLPAAAVWLAAIAIVIEAAGIGLGWWTYRAYFEAQPLSPETADPLHRRLGSVFEILQAKYKVDELYDWVLVQPLKALAGWLAETIDERFWHDWLHDEVIARTFNRLAGFLSQPIDKELIDASFDGLGDLAQDAAGWLRRLQSGYVRDYALSIFLGVVLIVAYLALR